MNIQQVKQALFARRNGVVAAQLRQAGDPHAIVLGCTVAELLDLAASFELDPVLAVELWEAREHRECRLLAPMLMPPERCSANLALCWALDVVTEEEADILCHRLLRHLTDATSLVQPLLDRQTPLSDYTALRLIVNLLAVNRITHPLPYDLSPLRNLPHLQPLLRRIAEDYDQN